MLMEGAIATVRDGTRQFATPCRRTRARGRRGATVLLADAEPAENYAEQVVGTELAGDAGELVLREPQFLG